MGVDEAGRGPAIGPLVVCALSVPKNDRSILEELGVGDSKVLNKKRRMEVYMEIISNADSRGWKVGLIHCNAAEIDHWMETGTLNSLEVQLFAEAILLATDELSGCTLFLDACDVDEVRFARNVSSKIGEGCGPWEIYSEHKMDSKDVVTGAASIVAKVNRDISMEELSRELGIDFGSGYPSDPKTKLAIEDLCREKNLIDCLRRGWGNVERTWKEYNRESVPIRDASERRSYQSVLFRWS